MLYKFKLGHFAMDATKNIGCMKGKGAADHSTVTRWFKKLDHQVRLSRPKIVDSESVLQAIEGLGSLFNGISTLFRLFNAKAILLEEQ